MHIHAEELTEWQFTDRWRQRYAEWIRPGGHGALSDRRNETIAWTPLSRPVAKCILALVTTAGLHLRTQQPFDVLRPEGDWSFREIPSNTPSDALTISHTHYNHEDANRDVNCIFPIDRAREVRSAGVVRDLTPTFFGLMGFVPDASTLRTTAPAIAERLRQEGADI